MMKTRYQIATLLGYSSWADYNAADKMVGRAATSRDFIQKVDEAAQPIAKREFAMLLAEKRKTDPDATEIGDYEAGYLSELVRRSQYDFDSQAVRPYLPSRGEAGDPGHRGHAVSCDLPAGSGCAVVGPCAWKPGTCWITAKIDRTILSGHASAAGQVQPRGDGAGAGRHPRQATARGGSGMQFPEAHGDDPGLMEYGDVVTFFHEFGHSCTGFSAASSSGRASAASAWNATSWKRLRRCWKSGCAVRRCWRRSRGITRPAKPSLPNWWRA